ncbi:hydroxysqualene dehydroxylase HpnE [Paracidobacterium acidisoli]|uniref:FAD-dependent oxidoreductase n=1 Tax=Paracidobacterium acidisoli TaxID=2303751 RepID=A0A372ITV2_9BACT|nr:hydroxysqualene dehydroxylase HpnE [Paracidobacterium acidisoli]MBT9329790.1 hydroxysqualene dehydroxylase HpnE [Paracidobacterium acidisoli]
MTAERAKTIAVVGGGVAGLAAACALSDAGYSVRLLERRPYVGGRASSYEHPGAGETIDNCQHILLGCCTNLVDLYTRLGVAGQIQWFDRTIFIEPGGRQTVLEPGPLPAPLHMSLAFLRAKAFSVADKLAIVRGILSFLKAVPPETTETFAGWLVRLRQTPAATGRFWNLVLASALNEDAECISLHYAAKVFREVFLFSKRGGAMGVPRLPLSDLYGRALDYLAARDAQVHLRASVDAIRPGENGRWLLQSGEQSFEADAIVLALSFEGMQKLLPALPHNAAAAELASKLSGFGHSPITSIHLWFDRRVTDLDHAVLLDTPLHWMYNKSRLQPQYRSGEGSYLELVVSASKSMVSMQRQQIIDLAMRELPRFFPAMRDAKLIKAAVVKEVRATYSVRPGLDAIRPTAESPWPGIFLAGDWVATGWPATMEGGVRSGYLAAEAVARSLGDARRFLVPDLPRAGLMRLLP